MLFSIKKNTISNYPTPTINCTVNCFMNEKDKAEETNAVYWIPFQVSLQECIGLTPEQIDDKIRQQGEALFNAPEYTEIFEAIELGFSIDAPEVIL